MVRSLARIGLAAALCALLTTCYAPPPEGQLPGHALLPPFPGEVWVYGFDPGWDISPGGRWSADFDLELDLSRHEERFGRFTHVIVALSAELRHDRTGAWQAGETSWAVTSRFTTTGMPIEHHTGWSRLRLLHGAGGTPFEAYQDFELPDDITREHRFEGTLTADLPADIPQGWYEPRVFVLVRVEGVHDPVHLDQFRENWAESAPEVLPLVRVGNVSAPRLPWTILGQNRYRGQTGLLPREERGRTSICARSGFPAMAVVPPAVYDIAPGLPTIYPQESIAPVDGGLEVVPEQIPNHLVFDEGHTRCKVTLPGGTVQDLGRKDMQGTDWIGPWLKDGPYPVDMTATGHYVIELKGSIDDQFGRTFTGGGTYDVWVAHPLTISTSCKPGNSFLVGDRYPGKVNVNPPLPAQVRVEVRYFPDSDPDRLQTWLAEGTANRFGHFVPYDAEPITFDEPGEYFSRVTVSYVDPMGRLWMADQTSAGVVAPHEREMVLHGTRAFPYDIQLAEEWWGSVERFEERQDLTSSFFGYTPAPLPDPYAPYDPSDTLLIASNGFNESLVEPHLTMSLTDDELAARLQAAYTHDSVLVPASIQPPDARWHYLDDVVQVSTDSAAWFPADAEHRDELPVLPARSDGLHPFAWPDGLDVEAYTYLGVIRPGFPAMTSVYQSDAIGLYWVASPNRFGHHFNVGLNGDLEGDLYRIQAGAVLQDRTTGRNYYDAYSAAVVVIPTEGTATSVVAPGERWLLRRSGREHVIFVTQDTHDTLELGEKMGFGGLVFPGVEADVTWTVTSPSGEVHVVEGRSNRLGIVRGSPAIDVVEPGLYRAKVEMRYGDLVGDLPGTYDGTFWHCAVDPAAPSVLETTLEGMTRVEPFGGVRVPLRWAEDVTDVTLHWGLLMPGMVLDQGEVSPRGTSWEYPLDPTQLAVQHPNFDVRDFSDGEWGMSDTVVLQFLLEGTRGEERVVDSLRLVMRDDLLFNARELSRMGGAAGVPHGVNQRHGFAPDLSAMPQQPGFVPLEAGGEGVAPFEGEEPLTPPVPLEPLTPPVPVEPPTPDEPPTEEPDTDPHDDTAPPFLIP